MRPPALGTSEILSRSADLRRIFCAMSESDPITRLNAALEGRYRIERELGEGGMARTVRAIYGTNLNNWGLPVPPPL